MEISIKDKISVVGLGSISTLLILLMTEVLFAQIITNTILNNISDSLMLLIIILGLLSFTIIIAFVVGYFITGGDIKLKSVRNASIMSLLCLILFLFVVSNVSLFILYRNVYSLIIGFDILWVFPQVLVYFSIYVLSNVFDFFILTIVVYYLFFVFFLEKFYKKKVKKKEVDRRE